MAKARATRAGSNTCALSGNQTPAKGGSAERVTGAVGRAIEAAEAGSLASGASDALDAAGVLEAAGALDPGRRIAVLLACAADAQSNSIGASLVGIPKAVARDRWAAARFEAVGPIHSA